MSEIVQNGSSQGASALPSDPHEEFQELCALATTGELTAAESTRLDLHLTHCDRCRRTAHQYEQVIATVIPELAAESAGKGSEAQSDSWSIEEAEATLMDSLSREPVALRPRPASAKKAFHWERARFYAVAALLLIAVGVSTYQIGILQGKSRDSSPREAMPPILRAMHDGAPRASLLAAVPRGNSVAADTQTDALRSQLGQSQRDIARLRERIGRLQDELATEKADLDRSLEERAQLNRELTQAKSDAQSFETRLTELSDQSSQTTAQSLALRMRVDDLSSEIQAKDGEIAREQELLQHDRDIRSLIGARNLYIAEIYDVAKSGATQKPFGRIFYTKNKSLVFYGYDLDQQKGVKSNTAFQAWGSRGADRQHAVSLGVLYQDDASQKRWVLKFNDAKTIADIDAVFITVEPEGGSTKPTGKPLLFTYLRLDPNHP